MLWLVVVFALCSAPLAASRTPKVNLTSGHWAGVEVAVPDAGQRVDVFYGVRYAEPPLNDLRFKHPIPRAYSGRQDASKPGHPCIQGDVFYIRNNVSFDLKATSEDCLHVNIYRPQGAENVPIAVYLHGGTFIAGFNKLFLYDPEELVAREKIIVVVVNYRLSVFGFLYLNHTEAPGNQGLYDMLLATKFIKQNAKAIGGDPNQITLWGQSAGAIGAGFLMSSPLAKGLFSRVFLQSGGTASGTPALRLNSMGNAISAASILGCVDSGRAVDDQIGDMVRCLKKVDAQKLFDSVNRDLGERYTITFQPMYGIDDLLPQFPFPTNDSEVPLIDDVKQVLTSTISDEGAMFVMGVLERFQFDESSTLDDYISLTQIVLKVILELPAVYTKSSLARYFPATLTDPHQIRTSVSSLFKDLLFECPVDLYSDFLADRGIEVYRYLWNHKPSTTYWPNGVGPTHCDDITFTTGSQFSIGKKAAASNQASAGLVHFLQAANTDAEIQLIKDTLRMVADFVKTGTPSRPDGSLWPTYTTKERRIVRIESSSFTDVTGPLTDKCSLWEDFLRNKKQIKPSSHTLQAHKTQTTTESNEIGKKRLRKKLARHHSDHSNSSGELSVVNRWTFALIAVAIIMFL